MTFSRRRRRERWVSNSGSSTFSNAVNTGMRLYVWKMKPTLLARQRVISALT